MTTSQQREQASKTFDGFWDDMQEEWFKVEVLQDFVINTMQDHGFRLGTKREYFHFDYRPDEPRNYH